MLPTLSNIPNLKVILFIVLLSVNPIVNNIFAQTEYQLNRAGCNCYSKYIMIDTAKKPNGVVVIESLGEPLQSFMATNRFKSWPSLKNYHFVYLQLLEVGSASKLGCIQTLSEIISSNRRINPKVFFYIEESETISKSELLRKSATSYVQQVNLKKGDSIFLESILSKNELVEDFLIPLASHDIKFDSTIVHSFKRNFQLKFNVVPTLFFNLPSLVEKNNPLFYDITFSKYLTERFSVGLSNSVSFKIPSQKSIQSGVQSKIMTALQAGDKELILNESITGHNFFGTSLNLRYDFQHHTVHRPYLALGVGAYRFTTISGTMQDTLDLGDIDINDQSSLQDMLGGDNQENAGVSNQENIVNFKRLSLEAGYEYRLSPHLKVNASLPVSLYINTEDKSPIGVALSIGFSYVFNPYRISKIKP
jgi:hypothetical protein